VSDDDDLPVIDETPPGLKVLTDGDEVQVAELQGFTVQTPGGQRFSIGFDEQTGGLVVCCADVITAQVIRAGPFQGLLLQAVVLSGTSRMVN